MGLLPLVHRHFLGARWQGQGYRTFAHGSEVNSREYFYAWDVWGRWMPHPRWQVMALIPYQYNLREFDDAQRQRVRGLGDVSLLAQFSVFDPLMSRARSWRHVLQVGGGVKLPTGDFRLRATTNGLEEALPPAMQPGTGSTDVLASALYVLSRGRWGISADASYRLTGVNGDGYRFGPRVNGAFRLFYVGLWRKIAWTPYLGAQLDHRQADFLEGEQQPETGGWAVLATAGLEVFAQNLAFSLTWSQPQAYELSGGFVVPQGRLSASIAILFGRQQMASNAPAPVPLLFPNVQSDTNAVKQ